jgi:hypothetical protein
MQDLISKIYTTYIHICKFRTWTESLKNVFATYGKHIYISNTSLTEVQKYFQICSQAINHISDRLQIKILET